MMKKVTIVGIICAVGLFVLLKFFQNSIPKINDPLTNIIVFIGFVIFAVIYGVSQLRKSDDKK